MEDSTIPRVRRFANWVIIALFCSVIVVPTIGYLAQLGQPQFSETEKRALSPMPTLLFSWKGPFPIVKKRSYVSFPKGFEGYFNDRFGFRRQLIQGHNLAQVNGLVPTLAASVAATKSTTDRAVAGRDGWLYLNADRSFEFYSCQDLFKEQELANWASALEQRRVWLAERGTRYVVMICPNKETIYPEYLPRNVMKLGLQSRCDQLLDYLHAHTQVEVVDLRVPLREGKQKHLVYYKTDSHWNDWGAYIGYSELLTRLSSTHPQLKPRPQSDYIETRWVKGPLDLAKVLDLPGYKNQPQDALVAPNKATWKMTDLVKIEDGILMRVSTNPEGAVGGAVIIHDSFMNAMQQYMNQHFQRIDYYWTRNFPADRIEEQHPQVVVQEYVERLLMVHEPHNPDSMRYPSKPIGPFAQMPGEVRRY